MRKPLYNLALVPFALSAAAASANDAPKPKLLNMEETFTANDYPTIAARNRQEGSVHVRVDVDAEGLVTRCSVERSSGHVVLDEQTCALLRARARFEPARDRRGRSMRSTYRNQIVWRLEGDAQPPLPRHAWLLRSILSMDATGKVVKCESESVGLAEMPAVCAEFGNTAQVASAAGGSEAQAIFETYFYPVEAAKVQVPGARADAKQLAQQVSAIEVSSDGSVTACEGVTYRGIADPQSSWCSFGRAMWFAPAGASPLKGTVVANVYIRRQRLT